MNRETKQKIQFNRMLFTLEKIAKEYEKPGKMRKNSEKEYGLDYEECLEMAYENIQSEAAFSIKGIKPIIS